MTVSAVSFFRNRGHRAHIIPRRYNVGVDFFAVMRFGYTIFESSVTRQPKAEYMAWSASPQPPCKLSPASHPLFPLQHIFIIKHFSASRFMRASQGRTHGYARVIHRRTIISNVDPPGSCGLVMGILNDIGRGRYPSKIPFYVESGEEEKASRCQRKSSGQYCRSSQKRELHIFTQSFRDDRLSRKTSVNSVEIMIRC